MEFREVPLEARGCPSRSKPRKPEIPDKYYTASDYHVAAAGTAALHYNAIECFSFHAILRVLNEAYPSPQLQRTPRLTWPATATLLVVNALVWLLQSWVFREHRDWPMDDYFALSVNGLRHGYIWQLLTYQFMHAVPGPWHLIFNSWAIFVFGKIVELTLGWRRMLGLYFLSGMVGGLVQMLGMAVLPGLFGDGAAVGASAGAFGLVAAFAVLYPRERVYLLLFFILPLRLRATTLLWVSIGVAIFGILQPLVQNALPPWLVENILLNNVAHAAHLGGILTGVWLARRWVRRRVPPRIMETEAKTSLNMTAAPD